MINVVNKQVNTKLIFWGHKSNLTKLNNKKYKDYEITNRNISSFSGSIIFSGCQKISTNFI